MVTEITHHSGDTGYLSNPANPDGEGGSMACLSISEDSDLRKWCLRVEVKVRGNLGEERSSEENNYGWTECSLTLPLAEAAYLHRILGVMIEEAKREEGATHEA